MLPQFNVSFFPSQIFWLLICFAIFFAFVHFYFFPKMHSILNQRSGKIEKDEKIHAHNLREIEKLTKEHESLLKAAKEEADEILKSSIVKSKEFLEERCKEIDINLNEKFEAKRIEMENEIKNFEETIINQTLNSAKHIIEKIENTEINEKELKKYMK